MIRRYKTVAMSCLLVTGLAVAFAGCSDSPSSEAPPAASKPAVTEPEKPLTAAEKRAEQRKFAEMGIKEKREWRRQQEEAGQAP